MTSGGRHRRADPEQVVQGQVSYDEESGTVYVLVCEDELADLSRESVPGVVFTDWTRAGRLIGVKIMTKMRDRKEKPWACG